MNGLSGILGAPDEQCEFEKRPRAVFADCGDGKGNFGAGGQGCFSRLDFARGVLLAGLKEDQRLGVNPYQFGIIASTDTHNGTPVPWPGCVRGTAAPTTMRSGCSAGRTAPAV
jgi:hypothetical protein